jgi:hypothetical protein
MRPTRFVRPTAPHRTSYQESSHASDLLGLVVELPSTSVHVRRGPLAVAVIVTPLVTRPPDLRITSVVGYSVSVNRPPAERISELGSS